MDAWLCAGMAYRFRKNRTEVVTKFSPCPVFLAKTLEIMENEVV